MAEFSATEVPKQLALQCLKNKDEQFALEALFVRVFGLLDFQGVFEQSEKLFDLSSLEPSSAQGFCFDIQVGGINDANFAPF